MQERQSNIELLRLFSMFALLILHFYFHSLLHSSVYAEQSGFWRNFPLVLTSFTSLQVNIFVLISGWFGIRTTPKKIISFYLMCAFYSVLTYCISISLGSPFSMKDFVVSFLPFSFMKGWWFVKAYLFLMLLAPLFNKAIEYMSKREYIYVLCALTLINSYYGFFCQQSINSNGGNFMQLMFVYFIGRYLALHVHIEKDKLRKWTAVISVLGVILYAAVWMLNDNYLHLVKSTTFLNRNNPWSMINSISIFLFFTTLRLDSRIINWLAMGVFPIYLIQESVWIRNYVYGSLANIYNTNSPGMAWLIVMGIFIIYFIIVLCLDHIRGSITDPIANGVNRWCSKIIMKQ